jgi:raffinose/stachyose/melibiose transport system substrate-binding protein
MKSTKYFLFMIVVVAMVLSACGTAATPAATQAPAAQPAATQPAAQGTTSAAPVQLVFWSMWNQTEPQALVLQGMMDAYTAAHPNVTFSTVWNGRENQTKLRTALSAGTQVDFMDQDTDQVAGGMMSEGLGLPLDSMLTQNAPDTNAPITASFSPGVLDQYKSTDGHIYLWPYINNPVMFWYNKDIFTKAGIQQPPQTWADFLTACSQIKATGVAPIVTESNISDFNDYYLTYIVERLKGPGFLLKTVEDKTGAMWTDPVYATAIQMIQDLSTKGCISAASQGNMWPAGEQTLATNKSAMELIGGWAPTELSKTAGPDFNWGGLPFPGIAGGSGNVNDIQLWTEAMMILKSSAHPQEVFDFFKFIMTKANQEKMANEALVGVTNKNVTWIKALADGQSASNNAKTVIMAVDGAGAYHPQFVQNVLNLNLVPAFFGKMTPADFSTKMAAAAATYWQNNTK